MSVVPLYQSISLSQARTNDDTPITICDNGISWTTSHGWGPGSRKQNAHMVYMCMVCMAAIVKTTWG